MTAGVHFVALSHTPTLLPSRRWSKVKELVEESADDVGKGQFGRHSRPKGSSERLGKGTEVGRPDGKNIRVSADQIHAPRFE